MLLRIRLGKGPKVNRRRAPNRRAALAAAAILTPTSLLASIFAAWRIAAGLDWTASFAIPTGPFSHWEVWLGMAALLQAGSRLLNRYGKSEQAAPTAGPK
jgi:hypothetical protein